MEINKLKIIYNGHEKIKDNCPFWNYKIFQLFLKKRGRLGTGYCKHPLVEKNIECNYGLSEIKVPKDCPLRQSSLVQKVELICGVENGRD